MPAKFTGAEIRHFDRVAHRKDVRVAGDHVLVYDDAAAFANRQPGGLRQRGLGPDADCENDHVGS
jgi:hypothetical protein